MADNIKGVLQTRVALSRLGVITLLEQSEIWIWEHNVNYKSCGNQGVSKFTLHMWKTKDKLFALIEKVPISNTSRKLCET